ncbi:MAG: hypothetical protein ACF8PN_12015 [Phycisphaerales bacterium]
MSRSMNCRVSTAALVLATGVLTGGSLLPVHAAPREYTVTLLGFDESPYGPEFAVTGLNNRGQTAGLWADRASFGFVAQPYLPPFIEDYLLGCTHAVDVTDTGVAVGKTRTPSNFGVWFANGRFVEIPSSRFPPEMEVLHAWPRAVNARGVTPVWVNARENGDNEWSPWRYDIATDSLTPLDTAFGNGSPVDVNHEGLIVGRLGPEDTYRWWPDGGSDVIGGISPNGVNDLNYIVGRNYVAGVETPLYWDATGVHALPMVPGAVGGVAMDVNNHNLAVGFIYGGREDVPALWQLVDDTLVNLNDRIDPTLGLALGRAMLINDQGDIVTRVDRGAIHLLSPVRLSLSVENLRAGAVATATATHCESGARVFFYYSTRGPGDAGYLWDLTHHVDFELLSPRLRGVTIADADGVATFDTLVESDAAFTELWIQAYHDGNKSEMLNTIVMP